MSFDDAVWGGTAPEAAPKQDPSTTEAAPKQGPSTTEAPPRGDWVWFCRVCKVDCVCFTWLCAPCLKAWLASPEHARCSEERVPRNRSMIADFVHRLRAEEANGETDGRAPACVKVWPECERGGYDPRCCRFPKSCSCGPVAKITTKEGEP